MSSIKAPEDAEAACKARAGSNASRRGTKTTNSGDKSALQNQSQKFELHEGYIQSPPSFYLRPLFSGPPCHRGGVLNGRILCTRFTVGAALRADGQLEIIKDSTSYSGLRDQAFLCRMEPRASVVGPKVVFPVLQMVVQRFRLVTQGRGRCLLELSGDLP